MARSRERIIALYKFIDWVMLLPEDLVLEYRRQVNEYQEERKMQYISSLERLAMQEGLQQGEQSGRAATVLRQLTRRLGMISSSDEQRVRSLSITMLDLLADDLLDFTEPADLQIWFARYMVQ